MKRVLVIAVLGIVLLVAACAALTVEPTKAPAATSAPAAATSAPAPTASAPAATVSASPTAVSVPATASAGTPQSGGVLKIVENRIPDVFGTVKTNFSVGSTAYLFPVVETLVGLTKDGPAPTKLATSWDIAPDGKVLTFHLRQGVKFHDGTDFNADAVKWNIEQILKSKTELKPISSIDVVDPYTVRLNLSQYSNALLYNFTWYDGLMISPASNQGRDANYIATHLVGTGPFVFVSSAAGTNAIFKKFTDYWDKGKPYLDELDYVVVTDNNTPRSAFLSGQGQVWDIVDPAFIKDVQAQGYGLNSVPGVMRVAYGDGANPNSPFAKIQVRQALEYAVDKKAIADAFGAGTWEAPIEPTSSRLFGFIPNFKGRDYDPAKAKQLLADAGYPNGFQTTIYYQTAVNSQFMAAVQGYLKAVGINADLQVVDPAKYTTLGTQGWQNGIYVSGVGISGSYVSTLQADGPSPTKAYSALVTPEYTAMLAQAAAAKDRDSELKLSQQLVQRVYDDAIIIPWTIESRNCFYDKKAHIDLNTISLQFWNPGDTWISK